MEPITVVEAQAKAASRLPLGLKVFYALFIAILVPYYWSAYGPTNFLYFCDVALLMTFVGVWFESSLLLSMAAVGSLVPQAAWCLDFVGSLLGRQITGMTAYMFNPNLSLFTRGLSLFHGWLPFLLVWLIWRLGYDRRAFAAWTALAWILMLVCYFLLPAPPAPAAVNINYVYGLNNSRPQDWMPPLLYLSVMMLGIPLVAFLPPHLLLKKYFVYRDYRRSTASPRDSASEA